ncbi:MAG: 50S ribosomal protein L29 [Desulfobacterota bacterium]|nr:50S ribosomal protein L29 [Thermodesulfobacteriota bacterium]
MKAKELRDLTPDELQQRIKDLQGKYFTMKLQLSTNQLPNTAELKKVRRDIARAKTILREKELAREGLTTQ